MRFNGSLNYDGVLRVGNSKVKGFLRWALEAWGFG